MAKMLGVSGLWMLSLMIIYLISSSAGEEEAKECSELTLPNGHTLLCPTPDDVQKTECCYSEGSPYCCKIDDSLPRVVMMVGLTVILLCLVLTVVVITCCFCPRCMMYDTCRTNYTNGEVIAYAKEEEMILNSAMPPEDIDEKSSYCTKPITIKPIADV